MHGCGHVAMVWYRNTASWGTKMGQAGEATVQCYSGGCFNFLAGYPLSPFVLTSAKATVTVAMAATVTATVTVRDRCEEPRADRCKSEGHRASQCSPTSPDQLRISSTRQRQRRCVLRFPTASPCRQRNQPGPIPPTIPTIFPRNCTPQRAQTSAWNPLGQP